MIIVLDMDGTLLNSKGEISKRNRDAIVSRQHSKGDTVVIATGRSYNDAKQKLQKAGIHSHIISLNGGIVYLDSGEKVDSYSVDKMIVRDNLTWIRSQPDLYVEIYTESNVFAGSHNRKNLESKKEQLAKSNPELKLIIEIQFQQATVTYTDEIEKIWLSSTDDIYKILVFSLNEDLLKEVHRRFSESNQLSITSSHTNNLEINNLHATKGTALKKLVDYLNMDIKETIAFGDSHNDLSMFTVSQYRVAMKNAISPLKKSSDFITASNDEDGVALILEQSIEKSHQIRDTRTLKEH